MPITSMWLDGCKVKKNKIEICSLWLRKNKNKTQSAPFFLLLAESSNWSLIGSFRVSRPAADLCYSAVTLSTLSCYVCTQLNTKKQQKNISWEKKYCQQLFWRLNGSNSHLACCSLIVQMCKCLHENKLIQVWPQSHERSKVTNKCVFI